MARSVIFSPGPYHILSYGTVLGTTIFHTFANSIIAFRTLEPPQVHALQRAIFPVYSGMQTVLPVVMALTYPGSRVAAKGIRGVLDEANRWDVLLPIATVFVTGLINWVYCAPAADALSEKRRIQEKKDGKRSWDAPPHSDEMEALNKRFIRIHGISSVLNLMTAGASIAYGFTLAQ